MSSARRLAAGGFALLLISIPLAGLLVVTGCRKQEELFIDTNLAPDTRLTSAPAPYAQANYRVHFYWDGTDPDGYIAGYYFAWDETTATAWEWTTKTDSLFKAKIDTAGETKRHSFYVRAVDNEGKPDPSAAKVRFEAWTDAAECTELYRIGGPWDPESANYDSTHTVKDTVVMGDTCSFWWTGEDPDYPEGPIEFSYRLDSARFPPWSSDTTHTVTRSITSGKHTFYVKARDEAGAESFPRSYPFVMNYDPDSELTQPDTATGTLTVPDGSRIVFKVRARDREEWEGAEGGITKIWIDMDNTTIGFDDPPESGGWYTAEWSFTALTDTAEHLIRSTNYDYGGNKSHIFKVWAVDVEGRMERSSSIPEDWEIFKFWYNYPPRDSIEWPANGATVTLPFCPEWDGSDRDGWVSNYEYYLDHLDPLQPGGLVWTTGTTVCYDDLAPGHYRFGVRARDNSGCWARDGYRSVEIYVE